ncbi:MAG: type VI secretion system tip protein TssI/VgrG [Nannocystaceae bacterium]
MSHQEGPDEGQNDDRGGSKEGERGERSTSEGDGENAVTALPKVRYAFTISKFPDVVFRVRSLYLVEKLSRPYELNLEIVTRDRDFSLDDLLGESCELTIDREILSRSVFGIIQRFDFVGVATDEMLIRVYVGPACALMDQRVNCRIWQGDSVKKIVEDLLDDGLASYGRSYRWALDEPPATRDYCVQYDESDLNAVQRLLEDEGISYYFEHRSDDGAEVMVMTDANRFFPQVETSDLSSEVPIAMTNAGNADVETIQFFDLCRALHSTSVTQRNFDFKRPRSLFEYAQAGVDARGLEREVFRSSPGRFLADRGRRQSSLFAEELAVGGNVGRGRSCVTGFAPGTCFDLNMYGETTKYLVTQIVHRGDCPEEVLTEGLDPQWASERYENSFDCIPFDVAFRPARSALKPRIRGPQTATVVGRYGLGAEGGSEDNIYTDEHGRICVKFHWDRRDPAGDSSSCWVRVRHTWAGANWGAMFIPRIGMEVVVDFVDGDPDQPLVSGCVYNGVNLPPYPLPAERTKSTLKSCSSPPFAEGYNELCFEDQVGNEVISLHAQKDLVETVLHNHNTTVKGNNSNTVSGSQSIRTGPRTITVRDKEEKTINGTRTITVRDKDEEFFKTDRLTEVTGRDELTATIDMVHLTPSYTLTGADKIVLQTDAAQSALTMTQRDASIEAKSINATGLDTVKIQVGGNTITVVSGGITIESAAKVGIAVGGSKVEVSPTGVSVSGAMIKLNC